MKKNLKSTSEIVEILAKVANDALENKAEVEACNMLLRVAKHSIQIYALLLENSKMRKSASRTLKALEME